MKNLFYTLFIYMISVSIINAQDSVSSEQPTKTDTDQDPRDLDFNHNEGRGQWYTSLTLQLSTSSAENEDQFIRELHSQDNGSFQVGVQGGYFIKDFFMVGLEFQYKSSNKDELYTANDETTHLREISHGYFFAPYLRNYIPLSANRRFSLFNQTALQVGATRTLTQNETNGSTSKVLTDKVLLGIGIQPGLAAFIADGFAFEASVGLLGLEMDHKTSTTDYVEESTKTDFNLNFRINLLQIKLAVAYYF